MTERSRRIITAGSIVLGIGLLAVTLLNVDLAAAWQAMRPLAPALPLVLLPGAIWHLLRTEAWRRCFPSESRLRFGRLFQVRLAAEAFSFVTIRGLAGEPLKVIWLTPAVPPMIGAAAVALERAAYFIVTLACLGIFSAVTLASIPLPRAWSHVFGWLCVVALALVSAAGWFALRATPPIDTRPSRSASNLLVRFLRRLAFQLQALNACGRRQLFVLVALELAAFAAMVLEVWVVLALTSTPVTLAGAAAIETFTRAASTASAFIPANLGALEASNAAAAVALHAGAGAAILALSRRLRGIVWCVAGFLVYPRRSRPAPSAPSASEPPVLVVVDHPESTVRIDSHLGGLPLGERLCRAAIRAGYSSVLIFSPLQVSAWQRIGRRLDDRLAVTPIADHDAWSTRIKSLPAGGRVTIVSPGVVPSPADLAAALRTAVPCTTVHETSSSQRVTNAVELRAAERQLRAAIIKPTDGPLARFNRRMSIPISVVLIRSLRASANAMSLFVVALGLYAGWLFSHGTYGAGVAAALVSLAASVLDGCDGELARLQYTESALGCWIDTLGDYSYYAAIFAGLTVGAIHQTQSPVFWSLGCALGAGVALTFALLILLRWLATDGHPEQLRTTASAHFEATRKPWARTAVRLAGCATRANMPYGILAFAILDLLPVVVVLAAIGANVYWIALAIELRALLRRTRGSRASRPDSRAPATSPSAM